MTDGLKKSAVFTLPPSAPFLQNVAADVLSRYGHDPLLLSDVTLLVPDRETALLLKQAFAAQLQGRPVILPKIDVPADMDDDTMALKIADNPMLSAALVDIPPAVSRLYRQMVLAQEILKLPGMASSLQKAMKLGGELGRFLDEAQRNEIDLSGLDALVPEQFREQWKGTAEFLKIITDIWPAHLEKMGMIDPEERRHAVIRIRAAHWEKAPPQKPVLAVGFADTVPAHLALLSAVAEMPQGQVVLHGVDLGLDVKSWNLLGSAHPQYAYKKMLSVMKISRDDVQELPTPAIDQRAEKAGKQRQRLLREAMRPAGTAEGWSRLAAGKKNIKDDRTITRDALNGLDFLICGSPQEEASVIALKMREMLEPAKDGSAPRQVALVTSDRALARRVSARLRHWQIEAFDEAGMPLSATGAGIYLLATARMAAEELAPVPMLEALKHPLATLGETKQQFRDKLVALEDMTLHGPRPQPGIAGVSSALQAAFNRAARRKDATPAANRAEMEEFITRFSAAGETFFSKMVGSAPVPFRDLLDEHIRFAEALAASDAQTGAQRLWRGDDGIKAARFLTELRDAADHIPDMTGRDYLDMLQGLMADVTVGVQGKTHPVLKIMTPEQARFSNADVFILGGLNDEVWPMRVAENPWLSPAMIEQIGLPAAEEKIGRDAMIFTQLAARPDVMISRSTRSADAPAVASPFVTRLMMVLKGAGLDSAVEGRGRLLEIHTAMHTPADVTPVEPPEPRPPVAARPKKLPVTGIETLMRDPYSVYAKYVLKLKPKVPLDVSPSVSERGIFTHAALESFIKKYPDAMPDNAYEELLKMGEEAFKTRMTSPVVQSFWWPRFERIAKWFVQFESERRELTRTLGTEVEGKLDIDLGGEVFTLTCIADRIDRGPDDKISIVDYKTGAVPSQKSVALGYSPQLTLEALIGFSGGFDGIDAADVGTLEYWKLSGGRPAGDVTEVRGDKTKLVDEARDGVTRLVRAFNDEKTPYLATPRPQWAPRYNNYEHLSRVGEWSTVKKTTRGKQVKKKTTARVKKGPRK